MIETHKGSVLLNCTLLSNLAIVKRPDLAHSLLREMAVTTTHVMAELREGEQHGKLPVCDWTWLPVLELSAEDRREFDILVRSLGDGEASCLAVAATRNGLVLTDDKDARSDAARLGIPVSGTIGLLRIAVEQGVLSLTEGDELLQMMIDRGYRSPVTTLKEVQ